MPTVLIADDDAGIRYLLRMILAHRGHEVIMARNGREAMDLFRRHRPAIAIFDLHMPGTDIFEAITEMHAMNPAARLILFTGADVEAFRGQAEALGADGIFQKGLPLKDLADFLETPMTPSGRCGFAPMPSLSDKH